MHELLVGPSGSRTKLRLWTAAMCDLGQWVDAVSLIPMICVSEEKETHGLGDHIVWTLEKEGEWLQERVSGALIHGTRQR